MRRFWSFLGLAALLSMATASSIAVAGGGPENVFLVVNGRGAGSMEVANHYIDLRQIPPTNVYYTSWPGPTGNSIDGLQFRDRLLKPILSEIGVRGLADQIDYIVYSSDFPWQVDFNKAFAGVTLPRPNRPILSLTSATYLHEFLATPDARLVDLANNNYCPPPGMVTLTRGFRSSYGWLPGGARVSQGGVRYMLCTALGFSTPSGNTTKEMIWYLERSAKADGTRAAGTFYFMQNKDVRSIVRQDTYRAAVGELQAMGRRAVILPGVVPDNKLDVAGLTTGSPNVRLAASQSRLLPGALVDNLTSAGGQLYKLPNPQAQTRISEFLRLGAAGASGTVVEPFAIPAKFPRATLHVHYASGASMAEAFYQSVAGPFQLLIVGDPLCQPWATIPKVSVAGLPPGGFVSEPVKLMPSVASAGAVATGIAPQANFELFVDGIRKAKCGAGETLTLDPSGLGDGYHEIRVVAIDASPVETQGRWVAGVMVKLGRDAVQAAPDGGTEIAGPQVRLTVTTTVNRPIALFHNEREVARTRNGSGVVTIDAAKLGKGPIQIQARAVGEPPLRSRPVRLTIL